MITVSICVPVYGVERYIERCARSIFEQTYENIEYVFVDDCSPDKSIDILRGLMEDYPNRKPYIKIICHEHNRGLAAARNTAITNATGDFIYHVDSDDYVDKDLVEKCMEEQIRSDSDIILVPFRKILKHTSEICEVSSITDVRQYTVNLLSLNCNHSVWAGIRRTSLYKDHSISVKEGVNNTEDLQVTPRLAYYANRISHIEGSYYNYDLTREDNYTNRPKVTSSQQSWETFDILNDFFKDKGEDYMNALRIGEVKNLAMQMTRWAKFPEESNFYDYLLGRLSRVDKKYYKYVPAVYRPVVEMKKRSLVSPYVKVMHYFKLLSQKLKK